MKLMRGIIVLALSFLTYCELVEADGSQVVDIKKVLTFSNINFVSSPVMILLQLGFI